jgi:hypothetical protein
MIRWSFGLRQLFLGMGAIAVGLVALRSASPAWVAAMFALAVAALTVAILLVVFRRGAARAWWIGFATCGWMYLGLLCLSATLGQSAPNEGPLRTHNLVTYRLTSGVYHWLYDELWLKYNAASTMAAGSGFGPGGYGMESGYGGGPMDAAMYGSDTGSMPGGMGGPPAPLPPPPAVPAKADFINVAHSLWTLLLATLGGCLAWWLYATGPGRTEPETTSL